MEGCSNGEGSRINSFALVSYLPEPISGFLDRLRSDLVRECHARAHLTLLPPRPLFGVPEEAWQELRTGLQDFQPFRVELGEIEVFPVTQVIYIAVGRGRAELESLHQKLNTGRIQFQEPFQYHPHVTLAQDLEPGTVAQAGETAIRRWREFKGRRDFLIDQLTFVQNTLSNCWIDLQGLTLDHSNISI